MIELAINVTEVIRKTMGWCPNVRTPAIRKTVLFEEMIIKAPDKGAAPDHITTKWWNKYHNWILLASVFLMILPVKWLLSPEINKIDWMLAFISSMILCSALTAIPGFDSHGTIQNNKNLFIRNIFAVYILYVLIVVSYVYFASNDLEKIPGYIIIFLLISWGQYIRILFWEKKNRKTIVLHGQNFVAINSGGLYGDKCN